MTKCMKPDGTWIEDTQAEMGTIRQTLIRDGWDMENYTAAEAVIDLIEHTKRCEELIVRFRRQIEEMGF